MKKRRIGIYHILLIAVVLSLLIATFLRMTHQEISYKELCSHYSYDCLEDERLSKGISFQAMIQEADAVIIGKWKEDTGFTTNLHTAKVEVVESLKGELNGEILYMTQILINDVFKSITPAYGALPLKPDQEYLILLEKAKMDPLRDPKEQAYHALRFSSTSIYPITEKPQNTIYDFESKVVIDQLPDDFHVLLMSSEDLEKYKNYHHAAMEYVKQMR